MGSDFSLQTFGDRVLTGQGAPSERGSCAAAPVAQLDRALVSEAKGYGFDSRRAHFLCTSSSLRKIVPLKPDCQGFYLSF